MLCVPITVEDAASDFDCGVPALNTYFHKRAVSNDRRGLGKTYVLPGSGAGPPVLGFYTLSMADVETATLPRKHRSNVPTHPLPVALIGRLARDLRARGRGVGETSLVDAFRRIVTSAGTIGCYGVIVDTKDSNAMAFYQPYGFAALPPDRTLDGCSSQSRLSVRPLVEDRKLPLSEHDRTRRIRGPSNRKIHRRRPWSSRHARTWS
ncbi:MAG: GNAT family N-acetyltransferase [Deltaproteobacteria bacterium]